MGLMDKIGSNLGSAINSAVNNSVLQGAMGNMSEVTPEKLTQDYGMYLMDGEVIKMGFILLRDVVIFTDRRILDFDKQGTTGQKARVSSIYLDSVINVSAETAGFGFDDSEINIDYIATPYYRCSGGVAISQRKFEFPKKYNIQPLYKWLQEIAYANHQAINR